METARRLGSDHGVGSATGAEKAPSGGRGGARPVLLLVARRLAQLVAPTLLITGDDTDVMPGSRLLPELEAGIPNAESHVMVGAPHAFFESTARVEEFDTTAAAFMDRHPVAP